MHASAVLILAAAGFAFAQSPTSTAAAGTSTSASQSGCGESIDLIIESCLGTTKAQLDACDAQDWSCLCEQANNVLTCYNNCPSDPNRFGVEQTKVANCNAASAYPSSSATASRTGSGSSPSNTSNPTGTTNNAVTSSSAAPSATGSGGFDSGAGNLVVPAGFAAVLGLAALF